MDNSEYRSEQPTAEQPTAEQVAAEQVAAEQVAAEQPTAEQPAAEQPTAEQPAAEQPAAEQVAAEQPAAEQVAAEQVAAEQPAAEQPAAEQPAAEQVAAEQPAAEQVAKVKILHSSVTESCHCTKGMEIKAGDNVIVPTRYGKELARVQCVYDRPSLDNRELQYIERKAHEEDLKRFKDFEPREESAFTTCRQKIREHGLDMKLVSAHYLIDEAKILFYFTAEARVDFRELVKDLVSIFKMRIELRQIGVRDEARVLGGMGVCGRDFCCHQITDKLKPVSIKMAKEQNLTLNSMKISGPCGRLLCCLAYEYDTYRAVKKKLPPEGYRFELDGITFKVTDINMFSQKVRLSGRSGKTLELDFQQFTRKNASGEWQILTGEKSDEST